MLDLRISLSAATRNNVAGVTISDNTLWGTPPRAGFALVVAAEYLQPGSPQGEAVPVIYNAQQFLSPNGQPIFIPFVKDGVLRVVVAAVPVVSEVGAAGLPLGTAYHTPQEEVLVRAGGRDVTLTVGAILGELALSVQVEAYTEAYYLSDASLENALARLNLRYLLLPYQQQSELLALYERALLYHNGIIVLFTQGRFLDAAATIQAAQYLLSTNGQTPDNSGPLLGGFIPYV